MGRLSGSSSKWVMKKNRSRLGPPGSSRFKIRASPLEQGEAR